jgi:hypothetical protein
VGVSASGSAINVASTFYYGVTSVDDSGDESVRTLGSSPAAITSSSGSGSSGAGGGGCFINAMSRSQSLQGVWIGVILFASLIFLFCINARKAALKV